MNKSIKLRIFYDNMKTIKLIKGYKGLFKKN